MNLTGYQSNRPVYRYEPIELSFLNLNLNSTGTDRFPAKQNRYTGTEPRRFGQSVGKLNPVPRTIRTSVARMALLQEVLVATNKKERREGARQAADRDVAQIMAPWQSRPVPTGSVQDAFRSRPSLNAKGLRCKVL